MRFLLDQDVYVATARFLRELGHDVLAAAQIGLFAAADEYLLHEAAAQARILVTRDRDYGALVFVKGVRGGVIYLRISHKNLDTIHTELAILLDRRSEAELQESFVVIETNGYRIRRVPHESRAEDSADDSTH